MNNLINQDQYGQEPQIVNKGKKAAPTNLLLCSKMPRAEKMAIFEARQRKILRFLIEENYSSLENLAMLLNTAKQTVSRIAKYLCDKKYLVRSEVNIGLARPIHVFQPTNTGILFALVENESLPELRELSKVNATTIYHDLKLQQIRINLEKQGYSNFQSAWHLTKLLRKHKEKVPKIPDYTCLNPNGNKVAIEYERTIKTTKRYREIIGQYMDIKERGIIKKVLYFTEIGFDNKLKQIFSNIELIYRNKRTEQCSPNTLTFFQFFNC